MLCKFIGDSSFTFLFFNLSSFLINVGVIVSDLFILYQNKINNFIY